MATQITKKIIGYSVVTDRPAATSHAKSAAPAPVTTATVASIAPPPAAAPLEAPVVQMHESLERPEVLTGTTYKVKSPLIEHAIYVTLNDMVLNPGTVHEQRRPFEIFINSKNMEQFQWIVALTRVMSAVFRKGGDVTFLVDELRAVFDPRGGYFKSGGVYMPSIVAELGAVIEQHLKYIGMMKAPELSDAQRALIAEKRAAIERKEAAPAKCDSASCNCDSGQCAVPEDSTEASFPPNATMCGKCNVKALVIMDNCATCLSCGYSKCG